MKAIEFLKIKYRLFMLGASDVCMPIDILSLSRRLEELYPDARVQRIVDNYISDDSAFVRRAMIITIRFIGGHFAKNNIGILREHLQDENEWVSYDAIWALAEHRGLSSADRAVISQFALEYSSLEASELENVKPDSAAQHRNKKAAEVLLAERST